MALPNPSQHEAIPSNSPPMATSGDHDQLESLLVSWRIPQDAAQTAASKLMEFGVEHLEDLLEFSRDPRFEERMAAWMKPFHLSKLQKGLFECDPQRNEAVDLPTRPLRTTDLYAEADEEFEIVLSYRGEVEAEMLRLADAIRHAFGPRCVVHGLMCMPGHPWDDGFFRWLSRCKVCLALLSPGYFGSNACRLEFNQACLSIDPYATDRMLLPVVLTPLPWKYPSAAPDCPPGLGAQLNQRNCFPNPAAGALMDDFETNTNLLLDIIAPIVLGAPTDAPSPSRTPAISHGYNPLAPAPAPQLAQQTKQSKGTRDNTNEPDVPLPVKLLLAPVEGLGHASAHAGGAILSLSDGISRMSSHLVSSNANEPADPGFKCKWMWGDTSYLARKNPARWSSLKTASETIVELMVHSTTKDKARPVLIDVQGEDRREFSNVQQGIAHLQNAINGTAGEAS